MAKNISSGSPFESQVGFSRARRIGRSVAISGTAPIGDDGAVPKSVYDQTRRCLKIIENALEEAGASLTDVIRTRVMLVDIQTWQEAARAHAEVFGDIKPACTFVEVSGFIDAAWLVEIEADAAIADEGQSGQD